MNNVEKNNEETVNDVVDQDEINHQEETNDVSDDDFENMASTIYYITEDFKVNIGFAQELDSSESEDYPTILVAAPATGVELEDCTIIYLRTNDGPILIAVWTPFGTCLWSIFEEELEHIEEVIQYLENEYNITSWEDLQELVLPWTANGVR